MRLPEPVLGPDHPLNQLRELWAALDAFRATPGCPPRLRALLGFLLAALRRYDEQAAAGVDLDGAFGLRTRGAGQWWMLEQRACRDRLLREIVRTRYADMHVSAAAQAILRDLALLDRQRDPPAGSVTALLARAAVYSPVPRSAKALRAILAEIKAPI